MKTEKDYEEFLELLNKRNVRYCIIGAFAFAFHTRPRYTKDIDILIDPTTDNAKRLLIVLPHCTIRYDCATACGILQQHATVHSTVNLRVKIGHSIRSC